jgi:uncharacterized membrane protein
VRSRRLVPPPQKATWADLYRIGLGFLMIPLGIAILVRTISAGIITPASVLMGAVFIAFGTYRLYVGIVRYRMYKNVKSQESNAEREKP